MTTSNANGDNEIRYLNPFRDVVGRYRDAVWRGTVPLPHKAKHPPPTGFTGHNADYPTDAEIKEWCEDGKRHNIGLRLAGVGNGYEIVGIDVDHYVSGDKDKKGGDQLAELETTLGPLPDTWISSARTDGISGIRYFRIAKGLAFRGQVDKDIECISKGYRFAVVWPSVHPDGGRYWWYPPGVVPSREGRKLWTAGDGLPDARKLPLLPDKWVTHLTQNRMRASDTDRIDMDSSVNEIYQWADDTFHGDADDEPCGYIREKLDKHKDKIKAEATSHDKIVNAHMNIFHCAAEGHLGWKNAIDEIDLFWAQDVIERDKRNPDEIRNEIFRSRINGLRKTKAQCDERVKIGAEAVAMRCDKSGQCGSLTDSSDVDIDDPLGDVPVGPTDGVDKYGTHDTGNAKHLAAMFALSIRFAEGYGWIVWHDGDQPHWQRDELGNQELRRMWQKVRAKQEKYVEKLENDWQNEVKKAEAQGLPSTGSSAAVPTALVVARNLYQKWNKFVEDCGNKGRIDRAIDLCRSEHGIAIDVNELDQNPYLMGVANGVLELDNEDVRLRRAVASDLITLNTGVAWEKPSKLAQDTWDEYLETFLPDEDLRRTAQVALGHCLLGGNPEKIMIVLKGQPNTGKSTMVNAIETALGDYASSVNHSIFQNHKLNPVLANSIAKRIIVCSEFNEDDSLSASVVKRITGGTDKISAEIKNSNITVEGIPQFVPILATNEVPTISGADKALQNRLYVIPFNVTPRRIRKEYANVISNICGPAILSWLVDGYKEYRRIGELPTNKAIQDETASFVSELDEVATFAHECLQQHTHMSSSSINWQDSPEWCIQIKMMYDRFSAWWEDNVADYRNKPGPLKFTRRMQALGYQKKQTRLSGGESNKYWTGVKVKKQSSTVIHHNFNPGDIAPVTGNSNTD